jgi:hypothetical protein
MDLTLSELPMMTQLYKGLSVEAEGPYSSLPIFSLVTSEDRFFEFQKAVL